MSNSSQEAPWEGKKNELHEWYRQFSRSKSYCRGYGAGIGGARVAEANEPVQETDEGIHAGVVGIYGTAVGKPPAILGGVTLKEALDMGKEDNSCLQVASQELRPELSNTFLEARWHSQSHFYRPPNGNQPCFTLPSNFFKSPSIGSNTSRPHVVRCMI